MPENVIQESSGLKIWPKPIDTTVSFRPYGSNEFKTTYSLLDVTLNGYVDEETIDYERYEFDAAYERANNSEHSVLMMCSVHPQTVGYFLPKNIAVASLVPKQPLLPSYEITTDGRKEYCFFTTIDVFKGYEDWLTLPSRIVADFAQRSPERSSLSIIIPPMLERRLQEEILQPVVTKCTVTTKQEISLMGLIHHLLTKK